MVTSSKSQPFKGERSEPGILDSAPTLPMDGDRLWVLTLKETFLRSPSREDALNNFLENFLLLRF